ncbi:MAG: DUF2007 domain-containing protein [Candidatus Rokubacteria bacterium]|nr:DUF2007 domain-containing protein [Candidatus Rokubacteria bacterium]
MPRRRGKVIPFPVRPDSPAARPAPRAPRDERGLIDVHRCDQAEAAVVRSLFESEGIPTLLTSRIAHSVHPFTVGAQGEVIVFVPEAAVLRARILLARVAPGPSIP